MLAGDDFDSAFAQIDVIGAGSYGWPVVSAALTFFMGFVRRKSSIYGLAIYA